MPDETLQRLQEQLRKKVGENPAYREFLQAVNDTEVQFTSLHRRDRYGRIRRLDSQERNSLMRRLHQIGLKAEGVYQNETNESAKQLVKKITALAAGYHRTLLSYEPDKDPKSLPELLEETRTLTLDTRGAVLKEKLGSAQNARQPLTFLDDKGREIVGVFTPRKDHAIWDSWDRRFCEHAEKATAMPALGKEIMKNLMTRLGGPEGAQLLGLPENADPGTRIGAFYRRVNQQYGDDYALNFFNTIAKLSSTPERRLTAREVQKALGSGANVIADAMSDDGTAILNNNLIAKIHDGARMDSRNAAMSAVAELLNVPKLLAKSVPMKIIDKNGRVIEGTFMREAEGVDISNIRDEDAIYGGEALMNHDGRAMKSIADLQVLDFICGNTDRHSKNVTYQFDKETGKFIGVQGYDNDTAFGTLIPKEGDFVAHLTVPGNMMAVSQSMYERLKQISPEMLKFTLRGYGLSEEELDAAAKRMQIVKDTVEKDLDYYQKRDRDIREGKPVAEPEKKIVGKHCRLVPDEEFKNLDWGNLVRTVTQDWYEKGKPKQEKTEANFFTRAVQSVRSIYRLHRRQKEDYKSLKSDVALGSDNRANPKGAETELDRARQLEAELKNRTKRFHTSKEYENMQEAVKNYRKYLEGLQRRIRDAERQMKHMDDMLLPREEAIPQIMDSVITLDDLNEMQRLSKAMKNSAQTYLDKKGNGRYETYTQNRIDAALVVQQMGENGSRFSEAETETVERNQHRAQEEINRRFGDVLEAEGYEEPKRQSLQPEI